MLERRGFTLKILRSKLLDNTNILQRCGWLRLISKSISNDWVELGKFFSENAAEVIAEIGNAWFNLDTPYFDNVTVVSKTSGGTQPVSQSLKSGPSDQGVVNHTLRSSSPNESSSFPRICGHDAKRVADRIS